MSYLPFVLQYYVGRIVLLQENRSNNKSLQMFQTLYAFGGCLANYAGMGLAQGISTIVFACATFILAFAAPRASDQQAVLSLGYLVYGSGRVSLSTNCQTRRSKTQINLTSFIQPLLIYSMLFSNVGKRFGYSQHYGVLVGDCLLPSCCIWL